MLYNKLVHPEIGSANSKEQASGREGENGRQSVMEGDWHDKGHPQLIIKFVPFVRDLGKTEEGPWSNLNTIL